MSQGESAPLATDQSDRMERYYRFHAKIYDATRWSFLFGRDAIVQRAVAFVRPEHILEVGCGTGVNLIRLCSAFPGAQISGLDIAEAMLQVARRNLGPLTDRVTLIRNDYSHPLAPEKPYQLVVCSYSLSMINPGWDRVIENLYADLAPGGVVAVVDFHSSAVAWFKRWMGVNHVRMDAHLRPKLRELFVPRIDEVRRAYGGLWEYLLFVGVKR